MKKKIFTLLPILLIWISAIQAQSIAGYLLSSADTSAIASAHIINISSNQMTTSNADGYFEININAGDTLITSNINYVTRQLVMANRAQLSIFMEPQEIQLDEVIVSNMPATASAFKNQIVGMGMQPTQAFVAFGMKPAPPKSKIPLNYNAERVNTVKYAVNKPISFLVKKLSKDYKSKVKYYETVANQGNLIANDQKFNREIVKQLTELEGENLTNFIKFMDVDPLYIQRSSEYEIALHIQAKFERYKDQLPDKEPSTEEDKQG